MQLTNEQNNAINEINKWMKDPSRKVFCLAGFAGTGKTTLLQEFINGLNDEPICCAPTGKAASVLQKKITGLEIKTIHKILYIPMEKGGDRIEELKKAIIFKPEDHSLRIELKKEMAKSQISFSLKEEHEMMPNRIVIVDESSMVDGRVSKDLIETGAKILFVGDSGQLPPVGQAGYFNTNKKDFTLETIHRQALDSPITRLAHAIRKGESISSFSNGEDTRVRLVGKGELENWEYTAADQILTGKNVTRRKMNVFVRKQLGFDYLYPVKGEKIICLKNVYNKGVCRFINGVEARMLDDMDINNDYYDCPTAYVECEGLKRFVQFYDYNFKVHYQHDAEQTEWKFRRDQVEFDFAHAITVHKSQGSEWNSIIIADDQMKAGEPEFRKKWLYTAITRAKESLIWIK